MQWLRLYSEFATDPKIQVLSEEMQRRYVMVLCLHALGSYEGRPDDEIALALRVTRDIWRDSRDSLVTRGLLMPETFKINGWEKRQYISDIKDPTAAERQRRHRDKKRNEGVTSRSPEQSRTDSERKNTNPDSAVIDNRVKSEFRKIFDLGTDLFPQLAPKNTSEITKWAASGCDPEADVFPAIRAAQGRDVRSWSYFTAAIMDAKATRLRPLPQGTPRHPQPEKKSAGLKSLETAARVAAKLTQEGL